MKHLQVSCAIIEQDGLVLAAQRSEAMSLPLKWEFPGGKLGDVSTTHKMLRCCNGPTVSTYVNRFSGRVGGKCC
jgi:hypothetical protein